RASHLAGCRASTPLANWMTLGMTDADTDTIEAAEQIRGTILTDAADPEDRKPWTIKGMPEWVIEIARRAAKARRQSMGEWLTEVIPMAAHPSGEAATGLPTTAQVPAIVPQKAYQGPPDLAALSQTAEIAKHLSGIPDLPKSVLREAHGLLRDRLKAARRTGSPVGVTTQHPRL